jgi:hypothetical protein
MKTCTKCGKKGRPGVDFTVQKTRTLAKCKPCMSAENIQYLRERRAVQRAARDAAGQGPAYRQSAAHQLFEDSLQALETEWGAPFAQWTRAQHEQHSRWLRAQAGITEDPQPAREWAA